MVGTGCGHRMPVTGGRHAAGCRPGPPGGRIRRDLTDSMRLRGSTPSAAAARTLSSRRPSLSNWSRCAALRPAIRRRCFGAAARLAAVACCAHGRAAPRHADPDEDGIDGLEEEPIEAAAHPTATRSARVSAGVRAAAAAADRRSAGSRCRCRAARAGRPLDSARPTGANCRRPFALTRCGQSAQRRKPPRKRRS